VRTSKRSILSCAVVAAISLLAFACDPPSTTADYPPLRGSGVAPSDGPLTARYTVLPYTGSESAAAAASVPTIPRFKHTVTSRGGSFTYKQVGKDPFVQQANPVTSVPVKVIPVSFTFTSTGHVYDPTTATCSTGGAPTALLANSPVEKTRAYTVGGKAVGTSQYADFARRAEVFKLVKPGSLNPGYHVNLAFAQLNKISVNISGPSENGTGCGRLGLIDINSWDNFVRNTLMPQLASQGVTPSTFPFFLFKNVVLTAGGCCIIGYHSAFNNPSFGNAFQTYGVGDFETTNRFAGLHDISAITHEVSEWLDDPNGVNPTPPWGHIGQVPGCQSNLEVGDPLSGTIIAITMNGFTYHPQEMAFTSWFYPGSPNTGLNGKFSSNGTVTTAALACT
jgi:hypothetical protein